MTGGERDPGEGVLSPPELREAVHLHILARLSILGTDAFILKGGVNLRLFYSSIRYSEDMDIDGSRDAASVINNKITDMLGDATLIRSLQELGIRTLDLGEGPNKDTATTFRFKFGIVAGTVRYPTKVEVSYREIREGDGVLVKPASQELVSKYLGSSVRLEIPHYSRDAMIRQKIVALALRTQPQTRDIFDLDLLTKDIEETTTLSVADMVSTEDLRQARDRALDMNYEEYRGQVLDFLETEDRAAREGESRWEGTCLSVADVLETMLTRKESSLNE